MKLLHMCEALGFVFTTLFMVWDLNPNISNKIAMLLGASMGVIGAFLGNRIYYIAYGRDDE